MSWWSRLRARMFGASPTYDGVGGGRRARFWQVGNPGAVAALALGKSLLPAGVRSVEGRFGRGEPVAILDPKGAARTAGVDQLAGQLSASNSRAAESETARIAHHNFGRVKVMP